MSYISLVGGDTSSAEAVLRKRFPSFDCNDAATRFTEAASVDDKIRCLSVIAVAAPQEFEQLSYNAIRSALKDDELEVRSAAVVATIYAPWPEFLPYLERVAADPDNAPEVRETVSAVAETIRG